MLNIKPYRQKPELCGPASLKMVLDFFGIEKTEEELARMAGYLPGKGTKSEGLVRTAQELGLKAFQKDFSEINDLKEYAVNKNTPVIVDWFSVDGGHYSVITGVDEKNIYMQDPESIELKTLDIETFKAVWFDFRGDYLKSKDDIIIRRMIVVSK
jgi:ABC-type bacteriocin/lantibiotic exporter with double-glycine peptidase domain